MHLASFGPIGTCFFGYKSFYFIFFYLYLLLQHPPTTKRRPAPTPPPSLANASRGWAFLFLRPKHATPPSSLANTSRGWAFPSPNIRPMNAGCPQQLTNGSQQPQHSSDPNTQAHPPRSQTRAEGGFFHHPPSGKRTLAAHSSQRTPTQTHKGQQWPTQAHSSQRRPT